MRIVDTKIRHGTKRSKSIFSLDVCSSCIITSSVDGEVKIWNNEYEQIRVIKKHSGAVLCVRFNCDGSLFASGGDDRMVFVCRMNGDVVASTSEHESDVSNVMWTDKFLISTGYDGYVVFYDLESFGVVKKIRTHDGQVKGISVDKNFRYMCTQGDDGIVLYDGFEVVKRMNASEGVILESFFSRMSWSPDGKFLASGLSFNNTYNSVEMYNNDLQNECSFIGHVAPCEVVSFNPHVYKRDKRYYIVAVSSQDLSVSFWCSLSPRPFLLIKNLTELPVLDMCWNADGTSLFVCSYSGEVKRIDVRIDEFGERCDDGEEMEGEIFFSQENMKMFNKMDKDEEVKMKVKRRVIQPVLISDDPNEIEMNTNHSYLAILNHKNKRCIEKMATSSLSRTFGDYKIDLNDDRTCISVRRGPDELYKIHGNIEIVCVNKKYICLYTGRIQLYHLKTGSLILPFICVEDVVSMDVHGKRLLHLQSDGMFTVFSISRCKIDVQGRLPRCDNLISLRLHRRFFIIASFPDHDCFFDRKSRVWFLKTPRYNSIMTADTNLSLDRDETLDHLENEFLIGYVAKDKKRMFRSVDDITRMVGRMRGTTDFVELKMRNIIRILLDGGERDKVINVLDRLNTNYSFQPFVFMILKEMGKG